MVAKIPAEVQLFFLLHRGHVKKKDDALSSRVSSFSFCRHASVNFSFFLHVFFNGTKCVMHTEHKRLFFRPKMPRVKHDKVDLDGFQVVIRNRHSRRVQQAEERALLTPNNVEMEPCEIVQELKEAQWNLQPVAMGASNELQPNPQRPKSKNFQIAKWCDSWLFEMHQEVIGTANTHDEVWEIVRQELEAMHKLEPATFPSVESYHQIESKDRQRFEFSKEQPFAIYSKPKGLYQASVVAHALSWRFNTEARSCFEYLPSFARRASWDSDDENRWNDE